MSRQHDIALREPDDAAAHNGGRTFARAESAADAMGSGVTRALDIFGSLALLLLFLPLFIVIPLMIKTTNRGPAFFGHRRVGRGGASFSCYKFRSMVVDAEARLNELLANDPVAREEWERDRKLRSDPRVTKLGAFLRKSSLDELPQLYNVLIGEMSLVGPRPIVNSEVPLYGRYINYYCDVRPGITGLWQVNGRNDVSYLRRIALDVSYAKAKSVRLDVGILLLTVPRVILARGSY